MSLPNQLSLLRLLLAPVFLFLFIADSDKSKIAALGVFAVAVFTDWYDGMHARKYGQISKTGIFLDPLADKFLTSAAFVSFYLLKIIPLWMVAAIVVRDIVLTLLRSYEEYRGKTLKTSFSAKTKTFIQMTYIFLVVLLVGVKSYSDNPEFRNSVDGILYSDANYYFSLAVTLITLITGISYFVELFKSPGKIFENS